MRYRRDAQSAQGNRRYSGPDEEDYHQTFYCGKGIFHPQFYLSLKGVRNGEEEMREFTEIFRFLIVCSEEEVFEGGDHEELLDH